MRQVTFEPNFKGWQAAARSLLRESVPPNEAQFVEAGSDPIFAFGLELTSSSKTKYHVPRKFVDLAKNVALHSSTARWSLLYRVLWRLTHGEERLFERPTDADVIELNHFAREVYKDGYRMRAFLRFRETQLNGEPWFVAWYESEHDTVSLNADFFSARFANLRWSVLTPKRCMHWDGLEISYSAGAPKGLVQKDDVEPLWISYYSSIFNPARVKPAAMQAQLLKRNWKNLPEAVVIEPLLQQARRRTDTMVARSEFLREGPGPWLASPPPVDDLGALANAARTCQACPLWQTATCTVFGEGPQTARIVLVGEQPGDQEDRAGKPFIGPAGQLLDRALAQAGLNRGAFYVTNAVKHFKFEPSGKRRIHKTASPREIAACRPWLQAELNILKPTLIVALGSTASRSVFNTQIKVTEERGKFLDSEFGRTLVTIHPSALLRLPEGSNFDTEFNRFVFDLRRISDTI